MSYKKVRLPVEDLKRIGGHGGAKPEDLEIIGNK